jgi:hypothetical protein
MTAPNIPASEASITVTINTECDTFNKPLTRSYYQSKTGENIGFGGEFQVEEVSPDCFVTPVCIGSFRFRWTPNDWFNVTYSGYGYFFDDEIGIIP